MERSKTFDLNMIWFDKLDLNWIWHIAKSNHMQIFGPEVIGEIWTWSSSSGMVTTGIPHLGRTHLGKFHHDRKRRPPEAWNWNGCYKGIIPKWFRKFQVSLGRYNLPSPFFLSWKKLSRSAWGLSSGCAQVWSQSRSGQVDFGGRCCTGWMENDWTSKLWLFQ